MLSATLRRQLSGMSRKRSFCGRSEGRLLHPFHIRSHTMFLYSSLSIGADELFWTGIGMTKSKKQPSIYDQPRSRCLMISPPIRLR